jgi:hypothetical protein
MTTTCTINHGNWADEALAITANGPYLTVHGETYYLRHCPGWKATYAIVAEDLRIIGHVAQEPDGAWVAWARGIERTAPDFGSVGGNHIAAAKLIANIV